jgi:phosphoribosylformylglycinamidine synthase
LFAALAGAAQAGLVAACHDLSEGGLAVAAAEMAIGGDLGLELELALVEAHDLSPDNDADATLLFSESCSRFLVEVPSEHSEAFESRFGDLPCASIGCVNRTRSLVVRGVEGEEIVSVSVDDLRTAFQSGFRA